MNKIFGAILTLTFFFVSSCRDMSGWYEVTRYIDNRPVERWYVHDVLSSTNRNGVVIWYQGYYINVGQGVAVRRLNPGEYKGEEKYEYRNLIPKPERAIK